MNTFDKVIFTLVIVLAIIPLVMGILSLNVAPFVWGLVIMLSALAYRKLAVITQMLVLQSESLKIMNEGLKYVVEQDKRTIEERGKGKHAPHNNS